MYKKYKGILFIDSVDVNDVYVSEKLLLSLKKLA